MPDLVVVERRFAELTAAELLAILTLRVDVFVVEQDCAYPELDGRDDEPGTRHRWVEGADGRIDSYLRLLDEGAVQRIGRVVTAPHARGRGLGARLVADTLAVHPRPTILFAQAHLAGYYEDLGFRRAGEPFVEDGIPHVPMRLDVPG